ncbi:hypothetical protein GJW-30_1_04182 [Variibacter gotjawalensis]|uniref:Uncharacterized protein n=1 Tax=Variibacter gotjawalensis TaxID=1333996 RepID=A0A0S3Q0A2_9BRAD|nr:hypothetical protein [Variibacter gotjawalensis]NIK47464.1 hypothetical protein [Variibacter gotjawalensis]RZS49359.1 hypothetical protein EV661_1789 [Variibacter gotjawalensis]BAT61623.1 hypothetical protein GJW-30_1_04182 [Variibacter gotjawalensis]
MLTFRHDENGLLSSQDCVAEAARCEALAARAAPEDAELWHELARDWQKLGQQLRAQPRRSD